MLRKLLANGTIIGFNLGDELICNGVKSAALHQYANTVRASFPRQSNGQGPVIWCECSSIEFLCLPLVLFWHTYI